MTAEQKLLHHFLAAIAYRTQKALRGAPASFADFCAGCNARTPHELVWHMTGVVVIVIFSAAAVITWNRRRRSKCRRTGQTHTDAAVSPLHL
jgi:hypothetical protein